MNTQSWKVLDNLVLDFPLRIPTFYLESTVAAEWINKPFKVQYLIILSYSFAMPQKVHTNNFNVCLI